MNDSATAMPGVTSRVITTLSGSRPVRAAWRKSSVRCADTSVLATTVTVSARTIVSGLLARIARPVVVRGIPIDGVDVIHSTLRRVLDDEGGSLDAEVRGAARGRGAAPGKVGLGKAGPNLVHPWRGERAVGDPGPLVDEVHEHRLLRCRQRRCAQALRLYGSSVLAGPEHEVGHVVAEDGLFPLRGIQGRHQRERAVVLVSQRPNGAALEGVTRGLRSGQARRQSGLAPRERHVDPEVMSTELQHPRGAEGRHAQEREVILVLAEPHASAPAPSPKDLVAAHDLDDLSISVLTESGREEGHGCGPLRCREVAQAQPLAFVYSGRKVGPA